MSKPNRQIGKRPKVHKTLRLDADLIEEIAKRSCVTNTTQIKVIEDALRKYLSCSPTKEIKAIAFVLSIQEALKEYSK